MRTNSPSYRPTASSRRTNDLTPCQAACYPDESPFTNDFADGAPGPDTGFAADLCSHGSSGLTSGFDSDFDSHGSSDAQLIARALSGSERARDEFVARYRRFVYAALRRYNLRAQDRDDVYQELYARLWQRDLRGIRRWQATGMREFTPYLSVIIRNLVRDHQRAQQEILFADFPEWRDGESRSEEGISRPHSRGGKRQEETAGFDEVLLSKERRDILRQAIARLSARDADIVRRRYFAGQSYQAIGTALGMTTDNVGVTLAHIRKRLRRHLSALGSEVFEEFATTPNQGSDQHKTRRRGTGAADGHGNGRDRTDRGEADRKK